METLNLDEVKKLGSSSFKQGVNPGEIYQKIYKLSPEDQSVQHWDKTYGKRWQSFYEGWYIEHKKYMDSRRKELKVDEFLEKLQKLCNEYKVYIYAGSDDDGCAYAEDYYFTIQTKQQE